jgi:hypothetical protein
MIFQFFYPAEKKSVFSTTTTTMVTFIEEKAVLKQSHLCFHKIFPCVLFGGERA